MSSGRISTTSVQGPHSSNPDDVPMEASRHRRWSIPVLVAGVVVVAKLGWWGITRMEPSQRQYPW
jgi:hypothetical protein